MATMSERNELVNTQMMFARAGGECCRCGNVAKSNVASSQLEIGFGIGNTCTLATLNKMFAQSVAGGAMNEMLVTLGNEAGFSPSEHFERLAQCGAIRSFELGGGRDEYLKRARVVLADGVECEATICANGERTDITTLRFGGSADFDAYAIRRFVAAIKPLWAGMDGECCASSQHPVCSSLAHLSRIPRLAQFSYWSRRYDALFAGELSGLSQFVFCRVQECADGFWVEIKADGVYDLDAKRRIAERFLVSDGMWDDGAACASNAVWLALHNAQNLSDAVAWKERWRKDRTTLASERQAEIVAAAMKAVRERGFKRRAGDLCSIVAYDDGCVGTAWIETSFEEMEAWVRRAMAAGMVVWGVILCDFSANIGTSREVAFTATIYDSLMNNQK